MKGVKKVGIVMMGLFFCCSVSVPGVYGAGDKVLAKVGTKTITQADLEAKVAMLPPQFRARYETPEGKQKLLDQTIKFSLLSQEARSKGIHKKDDVAKKIEEITSNIIIQELTKSEISDKVTVDDAAIKKYYNENKKAYLKPEKVKANLIFFQAKQEASSADKKVAKEKAEKTLKKLKKGEDFEKLAKELSDDKRTKRRGGSTGFFSKGKRIKTYGEQFEQKVFAMKVGDLSDVFEGKDGYYIIKIADKKAEKQQSLDEVRARIERKMKQEKQKEAYDTYVEGLKKKYPVKIFD